MKLDKFINPKYQSGQVSRLLLVLAVVILVAVIIVFLVMRMANPAPKPETQAEPVIPQPVYEKQLGDILFLFQSSQDLGNVLRVANAGSEYKTYLKDLISTERFIIVTVGAQNKGKINIASRTWDIGDIVDSEGRRFVPIDSYVVGPWLPSYNNCGALLKPEFDALSCSKIYEVSKVSTGLKITIVTGKNNDANNFASGDVYSDYLDLIIK